MTHASRATPERAFHRLLIAVCLCLLVIETVQAAEWRFRPRVTVRETFSDNINLSATDPEHDFVTDISPGFTLNGTGRRFFLNVFYNLQYLDYARDTAEDTFNNQFQLVGNGEVVQDLFFIDLRGSVRQSIITNRANTPNSTISASDNLTDTYSAVISPYLLHRFGSFMDGEARYTYSRVDNSTGRSGSESNAALLDFKSGTQFQTVTWNTFYRGYRENPELGQTITFQRAEINGRYHFNRKVALLFGTGYEDNEFFTLKTESTSAVTWLAGLSLTPNPRTFLEGGAQNRFFGVAPFVNATYRSKRTALAFHYSEDLTTTNQSVSGTTFIPLLDPFGDPILDPNTGDAIEVPIDSLGIQNQVLVRRRFDGTIAVRGRRTDVGVTLFDTQRDFQISPDEEVYGATAFVNRRISRPTSIRLWARATRSEFDGPTPNRTQWQVGIGLNRQFSKNFSGRVDYRYINQDSKDANLDYDENRITLMLTKYF